MTPTLTSSYLPKNLSTNSMKPCVASSSTTFPPPLSPNVSAILQGLFESFAINSATTLKKRLLSSGMYFTDPKMPLSVIASGISLSPCERKTFPSTTFNGTSRRRGTQSASTHSRFSCGKKDFRAYHGGVTMSGRHQLSPTRPRSLMSAP
jgi:hypothetical protein